MWVLDFDCCNAMSMDEAGVEHAALSFHENKLYCPRPGGEKDEERELWEGSRETVLERSRVFRGGRADWLRGWSGGYRYWDGRWGSGAVEHHVIGMRNGAMFLICEGHQNAVEQRGKCCVAESAWQDRLAGVRSYRAHPLGLRSCEARQGFNVTSITSAFFSTRPLLGFCRLRKPCPRLVRQVWQRPMQIA